MIVAEALAAGLQRHGIDVIFSQCFPCACSTSHRATGSGRSAFAPKMRGRDGRRLCTHLRGASASWRAQSGPAARRLLVPPLAEASFGVHSASCDHRGIRPSRSRSKCVPGVRPRRALRELLEVGRVESTGRNASTTILDMAIVRATSGRPGPVVLLLPTDLLNEQASVSARTLRLGQFPLDRAVPERELLRQAVAAIASAKRSADPRRRRRPPVGRGRRSRGARASSTAMPVATTNMGKGRRGRDGAIVAGCFRQLHGPRRPCGGFASLCDRGRSRAARRNAHKCERDRRLEDAVQGRADRACRRRWRRDRSQL